MILGLILAAWLEQNYVKLLYILLYKLVNNLTDTQYHLMKSGQNKIM